MKDPEIESRVVFLKELVDSVNGLMKELQDLNVDVRIAYIERNRYKEMDQTISIWRIEEHNDYL